MVDYSDVLWLEYTILGTVIQEPGHAGEVVAKLAPSDFSAESTSGLFKAITALHFDGAPIDKVTVLNKAGIDYEVAVDEVLNYYTSTVNLPYYCDLLRDKGKLRQLQGLASDIHCAESLEQAAPLMDKMNGLLVTQKRADMLTIADAAVAFYKRQESKEKPEYLTWGIEALDKNLYVELGDFVIVGGYSSSGKTLLSLQFALELAKRYRVGYFSLETGAQKLTDRIMSHLARVPLAKIKTRDLNEADWAAMAAATNKLKDLKLTIIRSSAMTVRDIQAMTLNQRFDVIIVDYLQLVADNGKGSYEQVTNISKGLHTLAQSNGVAVIALAQLSRPEKEKGKPQPPSMHSFRDSGQIEQDADVAILLWPSDPNDNRSDRVLKVAKNKEGERLKLDLSFDGACQTLTPRVPTPGEKYRALQNEIRKAGKASRKDPEQMEFTELSGKDSSLPF